MPSETLTHISMKKLCYLFLSAFVILLNACDISSNEKEKVFSNITGHWISRDYLITLDKTLSPQGVAAQFPFYATEILLSSNSPDSITIFNGQVETFTLPFTRSGDTLSLKLNHDPITRIIYNPTRNTLSFFDKDLNRTYTFVRADNSLLDKSAKPAMAFAPAINKKLLEGSWNLPTGDSTTTVQFDRFGQIKGWDKYLTYTICINGDCAANESGDLIVLNNREIADQYGFSTKNDTLTLFELKQINDADEKPVYQNGPALLFLVRKK